MKNLPLVLVIFLSLSFVSADEYLPVDNGMATYHVSTRYRPSEEHPLRIFTYLVHPIGWLMREVITRPFSYLMSSGECTRSLFGYREPLDYRNPTCYSAYGFGPDCRKTRPFDYADQSIGFLDDPWGGDRAGRGGMHDGQYYFPNVNFDFNSRKLNTLGKARVEEIGSLLEDQEGLVVVLEGHTDNTGSDAYNDKLGMDRAEAVRKELIAQGIDSGRLSAVTFGETRPLIDEETEYAHSLNRRVEVHPDR